MVTLRKGPYNSIGSMTPDYRFCHQRRIETGPRDMCARTELKTKGIVKLYSFTRLSVTFPFSLLLI